MNKRFRTGKENPLYKGGKTISHGYIVLTSAEWGSNAGRYEHRVIMEDILGRPLLETEIVHHVNGIRTDNRPENLEVMTRHEHNRRHGNGRIMICSICGADKWYSAYLIEKLRSKGGDYRCRRCSLKYPYTKICTKCGEEFRGGMQARFCGNCTEKGRGKRAAWLK